MIGHLTLTLSFQSCKQTSRQVSDDQVDREYDSVSHKYDLLVRKMLFASWYCDRSWEPLSIQLVCPHTAREASSTTLWERQ